MAASQFGALTPLEHFNQQQQQHYSQLSFQQQQQQEQQQQEQQQQQQQPSPSPSPSSQLQQQHQQQVASTAANHSPNGTGNNNNNNNNNIHPHLQSQPQSPVLNGAAVSPRPGPGPGPLQSQQLQAMTPIPISIPVPAPTSSLNPDLESPSATVTTSAPAPAPAPTPPTDNPASAEPQRRRRTGRASKRRRGDSDGTNPSLCSPMPPRPPTVHPFSKGPYITLEDAIFSLQLHVFSSGYGVSQKRTVKEKLPSGKYRSPSQWSSLTPSVIDDPDGDVIRKDFACDKGGNEFVSQSRGERKRESKKCGCPWKAAIRRLRREGDRWFIEILQTQHNHPVTLPDEMHTLASYRRWQRENNAGIRGAIARLGRAAAMPAREIAAYLKGDIQDHDLDRIDKQILRALSMNDKEVPGNEKEGGSVVFEMLARRPVIILQDNDRTSSATTNGYLSVPNPPPPMSNFPNPTPPTVPFNESPATYHHTFASTFTNASNAPPAPMGSAGGTSNMQSEYPVVP
ncbi:hypothetical protein F4859DRAFT_109750 [Xylaria cf. heliscus]|nr:hypothetical protein F4859DRAFT_109750 [Xylaria cf. heliscus]